MLSNELIPEITLTGSRAGALRHPKKRTRRDWGHGPAWTKGGRSYADRPKP